MTDLRDLILTSLPESGATVGNQALLTRLRQAVPDLTDAAYAATRDALVAEGLLVKGRGRGGSVALMAEKRFDATKIHTHTFPLADLPTALKYARERIDDAIKVVVTSRQAAARASAAE